MREHNAVENAETRAEKWRGRASLAERTLEDFAQKNLEAQRVLKEGPVNTGIAKENLQRASTAAAEPPVAAAKQPVAAAAAGAPAAPAHESAVVVDVDGGECGARRPQPGAGPPAAAPRRLAASAHTAVPLLAALDDRLEGALRSGAIALLDADALRDAALAAGPLAHRLRRRQDLEALEATCGRRLYLSPDAAVAALRSNGREIAALTYGWGSPDEPDVSGEYLAAVRRFLHSGLGAHVTAVFWECAFAGRLSLAASVSSSPPLQRGTTLRSTFAPARRVAIRPFATAIISTCSTTAASRARGM